MTKTTIAFTLLILVIFGCGAAAACVRFHVPPPPSPPAKYRKKLTDAELAAQLDAAAVAADEAAALAAADAAAAAAPYAPTPENNNGTTESKEMDANKEIEPTIPSGPPISTDLLLNRIVALLDSLRSPNDVTRAQLERIMDIKLAPESSFENGWHYTGSTDAGWKYSVFVEDNRKESLPSISIHFPVGDVTRGTNPSACTYELEAFAERLVKREYVRLPGWGQPRAHLGFDRQAKGSRFSVGIHVFKYSRQTGPLEEDYRYCVSSIDISAGESVDAE